MNNFQFYSQVGQDKFIYETFFKDKRDGVFLDIGAHDGINKSNTYFFEKYLGWTGVCVEPIPEVFERLTKNRININVNACISDKNGKATFWKIDGYSEMLSGLEENYQELHKQRIKNEIEKHGGNLQKLEIKVLDIITLLKEAHLEHVDYCSIDVEGSEEKILTMLDSNNPIIDVFTVENNYNDKLLRKLMKSKGYKLHSKIDFDDVYTRKKKWFGFFLV